MNREEIINKAHRVVYEKLRSEFKSKGLSEEYIVRSFVRNKDLRESYTKTIEQTIKLLEDVYNS